MTFAKTLAPLAAILGVALAACSGESVSSSDTGGAAGTGGGSGGAAGVGGSAGTGGVAGTGGAAGDGGAAGTGGASPEPVVPVPGVATNITLDIYSDGWGTLLETRQLDTEGSVVIDVNEANPYSDPPAYYVYARADGFYTELYKCTKGQSIDVDLDAVPAEPNAMTGVMFATQTFFAPCYYSNASVDLTGPGGLSVGLTTDDQGRYGIKNVPLGDYKIGFTYQSMPFSFDLTNGPGTDYQDLSFQEPMQADAPNLYLYPTTTTAVSVKLSFPQGGAVIASNPLYGQGWNVTVQPDGLIDGAFPYLFYEASLPPAVDTSKGWILDGSQLEGQLRELLERTGFVGREVQDFLDYWVPVLGGSPWYAQMSTIRSTMSRGWQPLNPRSPRS